MSIDLRVRNHDLAAGVPAGVIARSFLVGLRFDAAVAAYALAPLLVLAKLARKRLRFLPVRRRELSLLSWVEGPERGFSR